MFGHRLCNHQRFAIETASYRPYRYSPYKCVYCKLQTISVHFVNSSSTAQPFRFFARQLSKSFSYKYWSHSQISLKHKTTSIFPSAFDCQLSAELSRRLTKYLRKGVFSYRRSRYDNDLFIQITAPNYYGCNSVLLRKVPIHHIRHESL